MTDDPWAKLRAVKALADRYEPCRDGSVCHGPAACVCDTKIPWSALDAALKGEK